MLQLLCCRRPHADMGAALSHQEGAACGQQPVQLTMAEVIRERKKKVGSAGLATLRRRLAAAAARRPRSDMRADRGCRGSEHARHMRQLVSAWTPAEVAALHEEYEAAASLRDLITQAELAREPAPALRAALAHLYADRLCGDAQLMYRGSVFTVHRAILSARCPYFRDLLNSYPNTNARISLEGMPAHLGAEELDWVLRAIYAGDEPPPPDCCAEGESGGWCSCPRQPSCPACSKWGGGGEGCEECSRAHLDILGAEHTSSWRRRGGSRRPDAAQLRRLAEEFGFRLDSLHRDMRHLLDTGDYADASLVFTWEGGGCGSGAGGGRNGSDYGFRPELELPCHRAVLAARSPFFRSVIARRERAGAAGSRTRCAPPAVVRVCVDERVLPRRFARALLHAAYTDQVELSLVSRSTSSPQSGVGTVPTTAWGGGGGGGGGNTGAGKGSSLRQHGTLDDACELYEIARFLEMPIVVQGCEDAIVEALSGETLPRILEWSRAPHASKWVYRQAMRYLRDEFASLAHGSAPIQRVPRAALADALASPFLQASETQALRALLRWGERAAQAHAEEREPNVVWHTAHSVSRKGARRGGASDAELREVIAPLVPLLRLEHALPPDSDVLKEARRRGLVSSPPPQMVEGHSAADAWLGRGPYRPPRLFLPYYEEVKALLEDQLVAEADVSRVRRARYVHHIPDTLYMVSAAERAEPPEEEGSAGAATSPPPHVVRALRARARELRAAPPAARALRRPTADHHQIHRQIALRAVREFSLPDACAELVPDDADSPASPRRARTEAAVGRWSCGEVATGSDDDCDPLCRCPRARPSIVAESERARSAGSQRSLRVSRGGGGGGDGEEWRRGAAAAGGSLPALVTEGQLTHSMSTARYSGREESGGRLSEAVPDVAVCRSRVPNANTHLLSGRDYFRPLRPELSVAGGVGGSGAGGGGLLLDLGDGATHTPPRHGSRAHRAGRVVAPAPAALRTGTGSLHRRVQDRNEELRQAVELSVAQAYSSLLPRSLSPSLGHPLLSPALPPPAHARHSATLPHHYSHHALAATLDNIAGDGRSRSPHGVSGPAPSPAPAAAPRLASDSSASLSRLQYPPPQYHSPHHHDYSPSARPSRGHSPGGYS